MQDRIHRQHRNNEQNVTSTDTQTDNNIHNSNSRFDEVPWLATGHLSITPLNVS